MCGCHGNQDYGTRDRGSNVYFPFLLPDGMTDFFRLGGKEIKGRKMFLEHLDLKVNGQKSKFRGQRSNCLKSFFFGYNFTRNFAHT